MEAEIVTLEDLLQGVHKIRNQDSRLIWEELVKWMYFQFQSDHHVSLGYIGNYGYKIEERTQQRIPILFFNNAYLKQLGLKNTSNSFILKPVIKINGVAIASKCPTHIDKALVEMFVSLFIDQINGHLNISTNCVTIQLEVLGEIIKTKDEIRFKYHIPTMAKIKTNRSGQTSALRSIVEREGLKSQLNLSKAELFEKGGLLPKIETEGIFTERGLERNKEFRKRSHIKLSKLEETPKIEETHHKNQPISLTRKKTSSLKALPIKDQSLGWEMMGAGKDPLKKDHDYAKLADDPKELMKTTFFFRKFEQKQSIPIIDVFSRTLACPVAAQRQNPISVGRIGSNLSLKTQNFDISLDGIKFLKFKSESLENRVEIESMKKYILADEDEYKFMMKDNRSSDENGKLEQKRINYDKYLKLFAMIEHKNIYDLNQSVLNGIVIKIGKKWEDSKEVGKMMEEVEEDYERAIKKSIIDYILLDPTEQDRLSIYMKYKSFSRYPHPPSSHPLSDHSLFESSSSFLESWLLRNSSSFLQIQTTWIEKYESESLFELPSLLEPYLQIEELLDKQRMKLKAMKEKIMNWIPTLVKIYKEEISFLKRNQPKCEKFFEAAATLIGIQIRNLAEKAMMNFHDFLTIFELETLNPPDTVVFLEKTQNIYEKCFLNVRVSHKRDEVYFMDSLTELETKLLSILENLRKFTEGIPRPENFITKGEKLSIPCITETDHVFCKIKNKVHKIIEKNLNNASESLEIFKKYRYMLTENKIIDKWIIEGKHDRREYSLTFEKYKKIYEAIMDEVPFFIRMNMVNIDSRELKQFLLKCTENLTRKLEKSVFDLVMNKRDEIQEELENMIAIASSKIDNCQTLVRVENCIDEYRRNSIKRLNEKNTDLVKWIGITLYNSFYVTTVENLAQIKETSELLHNIQDRLDKEESSIFAKRKKLEIQAAEDSKSFGLNVKNLMASIEKLKEFGSKMLKDTALSLLKIARESTTFNTKFVEDLNEREALLGMDQTPASKIIEIDKLLKPFEELWELIRVHHINSQSWTKDSIFKLNSSQVEKESKNMKKIALQLMNNAMVLKFAPLSCKIAEDLVDEITEFSKNIPIISVFSNPGLKPRHFEEITNLINSEGEILSTKSNLYLNKLLSMGTASHIEKLENISDNATKEFLIEDTLDKVKSEWETMSFEMKNYKESQTKIITSNNLEEIQSLLDDHSMKLITAKGSVHAVTFSSELVTLEETLIYTNNLVELSIKVQSSWMYLEPVMTSPDILKHLSVEGSKFRIVDEVWKDISKFYYEKLLLKNIVSNKNLVAKLKECQGYLDIVMKGLNSYLESKRITFPRFFFLSNDELLEILSETKNPIKVQPHLKKCFEGIVSLEFEEEKAIDGMYSSLGEYVPFESKINTNLARGNVDEWLCEVEDRMIKAVKKSIFECHQNYSTKNRKESLFETCAMSVIVVEMTRWVQEVEENIESENIAKTMHSTNNYLHEIVSIIKEKEELSQIQMINLEALIILWIHNQDVCRVLAQVSQPSLNCFEWESQFKYYFKNNKEEGHTTSAKIFNSVCIYNHEYLGNSTRLVITPLTDRCYRILCSAIHLNYGGAPEGPAGTGKTETVKDLAKALANQCIVFNCSESLDSKSMGRFFKGLASAGAWSCFDEFNRINAEVLSVVAQQILTLQTAKSKQQERVLFEEVDLCLKKTANCFITMNPDYSGRTELPTNLKSLFRPVAMMIPNFGMIAEVSLYSFGFSHARILSQKIVTTFELCSEQLSSQKHYDYGMRAIKSVVTISRNLRKKYKNEKEENLILKAINDTNLAKLKGTDIPLFQGIISDVFKNAEFPNSITESFESKIKEIFAELKLTIHKQIFEKIKQVYEMMFVRHGVMIVGDPFSGKTTIMNALSETLKRSINEGELEVESCRFNPKSMTINQLFGRFDEISHEWFDGVLPVWFRKFANSPSERRKWIIFDGPVDTEWIENMNTVLDDNKKLCLASGETIQMSKEMILFFELKDLNFASPATVSRCGIIFIEPKAIGHEVLIDSWIRENNWLNLELLSHFKDFFKLLPILYQEMVKSMKFICYSDIFTLTQSLLRNLSFEIIELQRMMNTEYESEFILNEKNSFGLVSSLFSFSCVWSFGASIDSNSRKIFDSVFKKTVIAEIILNNKKKKVGYPEKATLYDYLLKIKNSEIGFEYVKWEDLVEQTERPNKKEMSNIIVNTIDTVRYAYFIRACLSQNLEILLCGPTGTGKTTIIKRIGFQNVTKECSFLSIVLSAKTSCEKISHQIESKLDKKGSKFFIGPKTNKMIVHIDDLGMPIHDESGAQAPIEYLRQLIDQKGVYDFNEKEKIFKNIMGLTYILSMSSSNNEVTPRLLRYCQVLSIALFEEDSLAKIFSTILGFSFEGHSEFRNIHNILKNSIELYNECIKILKPTPKKCHYIFNLRDLNKLISGICNAEKSKVHSENIGRLWGHEARRTFVDRLLPEDKSIVENLIDQIGKKWGKNMNPTYFSDIISSSQQSYEEISDIEKVHLTVASCIINYNAVMEKQLNLVLFNYALENILIILRILRQTNGHGLLIGLAGCGRKSCVSLSSFIAEISTMSLEISKNYLTAQFREDLKKIFKEVGVKDKRICFVFSDDMIKNEEFLEDINNVLNLGYAPNLFNVEEKREICDIMRKDSLQETSNEMSLEEIFELFLLRLKTNLKIMLCFSPIGNNFRERIRMFPSLINCTTISWFGEWPKEGLISVAQQFLKQIDLKQKDSYIEALEFMHSSISKWSGILDEEENRKIYVTPPCFIELVTLFKEILGKKKKENMELIYKYENGFDKIVDTELKVEKMKISLSEMKPQLKKAAENTAVKMLLVKNKKEEADIIMEQVTREEKIVHEAVNEANIMKENCEKELELALPQLRLAEEALLVLDKNSLIELKSMMNPPIAVRLTMQCMCYLIDPNPKEKMKNDKTYKMETDWWAASIRLLGNPKLLNELINFNKEGISENMISTLSKFLEDPSNKDILTVSNVAKSSTACECIIQWIYGIYQFYYVNKKVRPMKESLKIAEEKANSLLEKLEAKRMELEEANKKVEEIKYEFEWAEKNKERLEKEYSDCEMSLKRAEIIMSSLGSEKPRWLELSEHYKTEQKTIDCNILMASAQVVYFGPFSEKLRKRIIEEWFPFLECLNLRAKENFTLAEVLGEPVMIRSWNINGLPNNSFSIENAMIIEKSRKWPLIIDPQGQAKEWLKREYSSYKLKITKQFEESLVRNLENCIQFGTPMMVENLTEEINSALNPILQKQTYKKGATTYIKMGDNSLVYSPSFKLFMVTNLSNPHYLPEVCTQTTIINFIITEEGLCNELLALIVSKERPDLESEKERLIIESASNKKTLKEVEDKILGILSNSSNILSDETSIETLASSKYKSDEIKEKQILSEETEKEIDKARSLYLSVAQEGSRIFSAVSSLENLLEMYKYSLEYFKDIYLASIENSIKPIELDERIHNFRHHFRSSIFQNVGRSLFQNDRLMFAFLMTLKIESISVLETYPIFQRRIFHTKILEKIEKPKVDWLDDSTWDRLLELTEIEEFGTLMHSLKSSENLALVKTIIQTDNPTSVNMPALLSGMKEFNKFLFYQTIRPEKLFENIFWFVKNVLGNQFVEPIQMDFSKIHKDSNYYTPVLFVLSSGSDPYPSVSDLSQKMKIRLDNVSLGQGQGFYAEKMIFQNIEKGGWIILQNCHLISSWMPSLEKIVERLSDPEIKIHKDFRLWLTSYPSPTIPESVIKKSLKITIESEKGLKNSLVTSYLSSPLNDKEFFENCQSEEFKRLSYSLSFFHALIQERKKYGHLGWNNNYDFNIHDFKISCEQLKDYLFETKTGKSIPFNVLHYLIGECNYGGKVTDPNDVTLMRCLLSETLNSSILENVKHSLGNTYEYILPWGISTHKEFFDYVNNLPDLTSPEVVGLNANCEIIKDLNESTALLHSLDLCLATNKETKNNMKSSVDKSSEILCEILNVAILPSCFDLESVLKKHPIQYQNPFNSVLHLEIQTYSNLIHQIRIKAHALSRAILGEEVMTPELEIMSREINKGIVPLSWKKYSYPTLKPLLSYLNDLKRRINFFMDWINNGAPTSFWLSAFFNTQSFLTAILQNHSRKMDIPFDELKLSFIFKKEHMKYDSESYHIHGLFLEGAEWDEINENLKEQEPGKINSECPNFVIKAIKASEENETQVFEAPLYKTAERRGNLDATGHSSNFIGKVKIPSVIESFHWLVRGTALVSEVMEL